LSTINNNQLNGQEVAESNDFSRFGYSILNYYDEIETPKYFESFAGNVVVYSIMEQAIKERAQQYTEIMEKFSYISIAITVSISIILVMLILLENRQLFYFLKQWVISQEK
jgi:hypothetical protein